MAFANLGRLAHQHILLDLQEGGAILDVHLALNDIGYNGNRLYDLIDHIGSLHGVVARFCAQQLCLEANKIRLMLLDVCQDLGSIVFACEAIWIFSFGQEHHLDIHTLLKHHI